MTSHDMSPGFLDWWKNKNKKNQNINNNEEQPTIPNPPENDPVPTKPEEPAKVPTGNYPNWGNTKETEDPNTITIKIDEIPDYKDGEEEMEKSEKTDKKNK